MLLFACYPVFGLLVPVASLPVIASHFGAAGWATAAVGMSLGTAGIVFVELGWGLDGPQRIAGATPSEREALFGQAASERLIAFCIAALGEGVAAYVVEPSAWSTTWLFSLSTLTLGVSCAWFAAGLDRPGLALIVDSVPRALATMVGIAALLAGGGLVLYPAVLVITGLASPFIAARCLNYQQPVPWRRPLHHETVGRRPLSLDAWGARVTSSLYLSLPTTFVALVAPVSVVATFASADRLVRMGLTALSFLPTSMQAGLGRTPGSDLAARIRRAVLINSLVGACAALITCTLLPLAAKAVFSGTVHVSYPQAALEGILVFATCTSRGTGSLALVRLGRLRHIFYSALLGAAVGVPMIFVLAINYGATGALAALAASEVLVAGLQVFSLERWRRAR